MAKANDAGGNAGDLVEEDAPILVCHHRCFSNQVIEVFSGRGQRVGFEVRGDILVEKPNGDISGDLFDPS